MKTQRSRSAAITFVCFTAMAAFMPQGTRASIIEDAFYSGTNIQAGTISFPALSGSSAAGVGLSFQGFTQSDITSISWVLVPSSYAVSMLDLNARDGDNPCPNDDTSCQYNTLRVTPTEFVISNFFCQGSACFGSSNLSEIDFRAASVPEPAAFVLAAGGLLGILLCRHRRVPGV